MTLRADTPRPAPAPRRRPRRLSPAGAALRESLRDRHLLAQAVLTPLLVLAVALVLARAAAGADAHVVQVAGGPGTADVARALAAAGEEVRGPGPATGPATVLGAPGPGLDATVTVPATGPVLVRVAPAAAWTAGDLRETVQAALPGRTVRVLGPDGRPAHGVTGQLLPAVLVLTALVLALPGTAGRVRSWRRHGTLALVTGTTTARGVRAVRLAGALLPSRLLLAVPAVVVVAGTGPPRPVPLVLLVLLAAAGTAAGTAAGALLGGLLRTGRETGPLLWVLTVLLALFGGVLLPASVLPPAAGTVLRFAPTAWFADGVRDALAGGAPAPALLAAGGLGLVAVAAWAALAVLCARTDRPR
ncbi:ABC transporter permease [Kineococcus sp. LSe6-4]|uniref:ABC transporter permease n=1 Tax=Kineococcus halophytocola TaxID=3234027 RepID=A0ABV4H3A0_9ACTN